MLELPFDDHSTPTIDGQHGCQHSQRKSPLQLPLRQSSPMLAHCGAPKPKEIARMGEYCVGNLTRKMLTDLRFCLFQHGFQYFRICHQISRHHFVIFAMELSIGW